MPVSERNISYGETVKFLGFALSQYRLYSDKHPAAQLAVRNFRSKLELIFGSESDLTLGFLGSGMIANEQSLDGKMIGVAELLRESRRLQMESLTFARGVGEGELSAMLKLMATSPKALEEMGGFKKAFEEAGFEHIRLGAARYQMVKEEESVVRKVEIGGGEERKREEKRSAPARRIENLVEAVGYVAQGTNGTVDFDIERLAYEVEKQGEAVARAVVEKASDLEALRKIVHETARFFKERLAPSFIQEGKDFSQPISRFAKQLKKVLEGPAASEDFKGAAEELVGILEQCADAVRLDFIVTAFQEGGGDAKALLKVSTRILRGKEVRERLQGPLKERLAALGVAEEVLEELFASLEEKKTGTRPRRLEVAPEELEELRRIRDRFEEELDLRVQERTARLEREVRRALDEKERVDAIIRNLGEGLVVVDGDGKIQFLNPAAEKLLGLNQEGAKGVPISRLIKDEHLLAIAKEPLSDEGDRVTKEIELRRSDDETQRILQASTAVIENEDGKTVGMVSVLSDITKQKQLDEAKSKFLAHVSHELRTPLLAMQESLSLLIGREVGEINPEQEKFLTIAHRNIGRLSRLVNDLLDVAKLEAGKIELHPVPFEIREMVHHVVETVRNWAESKGVMIHGSYPERTVEVEADPDRLTQVVTNILGNAIKFTPEGGKIIVEVDAERLELDVTDEPCVSIAVQDSGIGIPKEDQKRIFEKFEQVSLSSPQGVSSTGFGLTIAREIVQMHGGKIWVESNEGQGSRFTFVIPRRVKGGARAEREPA